MRRTVYNLNNLEVPDLEQIPVETRKIAMREAVKLVGQGVREKAPVSGRTHANVLRKSIRWSVRREGMEGRVYTKAPHAHLVEHGAKAHIVRARFGRVMVYRARGRLVVRRAARHPGARANPFMNPVLEERREDVEMILREAAGQAIDGAV